MRTLFFISLFIITILPIICKGDEVQNPTNLTGTAWKLVFESGTPVANKFVFEELKFISATDGEAWMQPVTGTIQKMGTLTYVINENTISITPINDVTKTAKIDFQKGTITPTDSTNTYVFTKE